MNSDQLKRLHIFYHSLLEQQRALGSLDLKGGLYIDAKAIRPLVNELSQLTQEFPDLFPTFRPAEYTRAGAGGTTQYNYVGIWTYAAMVIGRLRTTIEQPTDTPVTEKRQFAFINNSDLRAIIESGVGWI